MGAFENYLKNIEGRVRILENINRSAVTGPVRMQNNGAESEYKGAFVAGSVTWNDSTGQPTGGTGGLFNEAGLFGVKSGVNTVKIDFQTGDAFFAGDITGASGIFSGKIVAGGMAIGNDVNGSLDGIYIDSNDYWYDNGNFSLGNGAVTWNGSELNVTGKIFSQVSGRRIGLEGERINMYDTGGVANAYLEFNASNILTLFCNRRIQIESTGSGDDIELKAGDALRFYYNGAGTSSDMEFYSNGDRKIKINQDGDINTEGDFQVRRGTTDYNGVNGTFQDNSGNTVRVRGGIITDLDE